MKQTNNQTAFTLIELIVVIVLLGILAITAGPRLLTKNQFSAISQRDGLISELRLAQLRAINDRSSCYAVQISANNFGIYATAQVNNACGSPYVLANTPTLLDDSIYVSIAGVSNKDVTRTLLFDNLGRPSGGSCVGGSKCTLAIIGVESVGLCIESEGYVHGC